MAVKFAGLPNDTVAAWQYVEDGISKDRNDTSGGVSQLSVSGVGKGHTLSKRDKPVLVIADDYGSALVEVVSASQNMGASWTMEASSAQRNLNVDRVVEFMWQVEALVGVEHYFASVGIEPNTLKIYQHKSLDGKLFNVPASYTNVWGAMKQWLAANSLDLNYVHDTLVIYPADIHKMWVQDVTSDWTIQLGDAEASDTVDCKVYHRTKTKGNQIVYPVPESRRSDRTDVLVSDITPTVLTVEAGETVETEIELSAELSTVEQPVHILAMPKAKPTIKDIPSGCYTVVGKDNKPITPAQWKAWGGGLRVEIGADSRTIIVKLTGMRDPKGAFGPFRIAESDGQVDYPSLYVVGDGVVIDTETVTLATGGELKTNPSTIDNPSIDSLNKAYAALNWKASVSAGFSLSLSWSGSDPLRSMFTDFPLQGDRRQAFGRISGTRFYLGGFWWRATSASYGEDGVTIDAALDQQLADWARKYATPESMPTGKTLLELSTEGLL